MSGHCCGADTASPILADSGVDPTRRAVLRGLGAVGAGALLPRGANAQANGGISPKPFHIDTHHHIYPTVYLQKPNSRRNALAMPVYGGSLDQWTPAVALAEMDKFGVATTITSVVSSDVWNPANLDATRALVRGCNEYSAKMMRDYPTRFGMFAVLTPLDTDATLKEIEYSFDTLKADGVIILSTYDDKWLGDKAFLPVFEELNRRKAVVFVHPNNCTACNGFTPGIGTSMSEFPFDTARTLSTLIYYGTFNKCPDIRFIFGHGGGVAAALAERWDLLAKVNHLDPALKANAPDGVLPLLRRYHYDMADVAAPIVFDGVRRMAGIDKLLFGSDFPFNHISDTIDGMATLKLDDHDRMAIARGNALTLFPRFNG